MMSWRLGGSRSLVSIFFIGDLEARLYYGSGEARSCSVSLSLAAVDIKIELSS